MRNNKSDDKTKKHLKELIIGMVVVDVLTIFNLFFQIYLGEVSYLSFIMILICNIIVFMICKLKK